MQGKNDIVIPLGNKSFNQKNMEIIIAVSSILKYCNFRNRIIIVGAEPPSIIKDKVIHIQADDKFTHCKDANIIYKVKIAIETISDLTDDFIIWSDDQFITKPTEWSDTTPRYIKKYDSTTILYFNIMSRTRVWWKRLQATLENFKSPNFFNPHIPSPVNKTIFLNMCKEFNIEKRTDITIFSLYYNYAGIEGVPNFDEYHCNSGETDWKNARWVGYFNSSIQNPNFRKSVETMFDIKL